jgi:hypothetical protein
MRYAGAAPPIPALRRAVKAVLSADEKLMNGV